MNGGARSGPEMAPGPPGFLASALVLIRCSFPAPVPFWTPCCSQCRYLPMRLSHASAQQQRKSPVCVSRSADCIGLHRRNSSLLSGNPVLVCSVPAHLPCCDKLPPTKPTHAYPPYFFSLVTTGTTASSLYFLLSPIPSSPGHPDPWSRQSRAAVLFSFPLIPLVCSSLSSSSGAR